MPYCELFVIQKLTSVSSKVLQKHPLLVRDFIVQCSDEELQLNDFLLRGILAWY